MEENRQEVTPDEKLNRRFEAWLSPQGAQFVSAEAEAAYKARATRMMDAMALRKIPDRVPISLSIGTFAARYAGFTAQDVMYDPDKAMEAAVKATCDFQPDTMVMSGGPSGKALEILDYRLYNWPGHGIAPDGGFQFVEQEYMKPEDYDALINDPSDYWQRTFLPRVIGAFAPFSTLSPFSSLIEIVSVGGFVGRFADPAVQEGFRKLFEAGQEILNWQQKAAAGVRRMIELGFPSGGGGFTLSPFDAIGDTMRGTRGIMTDLYRRPQKVIEAVERMVPLQIRMGMTGARMGGAPIVGIPLHKGADGFMSEEQFKTFYWPTLRKVILGLIEEGLIVRLFAEGSYNSRLEIIRDLPKGKTVWYFDYTDMERAKEILGDVACIMGNVPVAMIHTGKPEDVTAYCRRLIETAGKGGGYILATGAGIEQNGKVENIRAMIDTVNKYGVY